MPSKSPNKGSPASLAILAVLTFATPASAAASDPLGVWLDDRGRGAIEISNCGTALCGKVVWVKSTRDQKGCGASILGGVRPVGGGSWDNGWIYSPDHGRKFDVALKPLGADRLRVTGYAGIKMFGETRTWTRAPADLKRCDQQAKPVETAKAVTDQGAEQASDVAPAAAGHSKAPASSSADAEQAGSDRTTPQDAGTPATPEPTATEHNAAEGSPAPANDADADAYSGIENAPRATAPKLGGLSIDKVLKKTSDGQCKLDLPWLKVSFNCKDM